eukprot:jgi/Chlat1/8000/Chrsp7S07750
MHQGPGYSLPPPQPQRSNTPPQQHQQHHHQHQQHPVHARNNTPDRRQPHRHVDESQQRASYQSVGHLRDSRAVEASMDLRADSALVFPPAANHASNVLARESRDMLGDSLDALRGGSARRRHRFNDDRYSRDSIPGMPYIETPPIRIEPLEGGFGDNGGGRPGDGDIGDQLDDFLRRFASGRGRDIGGPGGNIRPARGVTDASCMEKSLMHDTTWVN